MHHREEQNHFSFAKITSIQASQRGIQVGDSLTSYSSFRNPPASPSCASPRYARPAVPCHGGLSQTVCLCWSRTCRTNLDHLDPPSRANFRIILSTLLSFQTTALLLSETSIFPHSYSRRASIPLPTVYYCATRNSCFTPQPDSVFASLSQPVPLQKTNTPKARHARWVGAIIASFLHLLHLLCLGCPTLELHA